MDSVKEACLTALEEETGSATWCMSSMSQPGTITGDQKHLQKLI